VSPSASKRATSSDMMLGDGLTDIATLSRASRWAASALTHPARAFIGRPHASREPARFPQGFKDPCRVW